MNDNQPDSPEPLEPQDPPRPDAAGEKAGAPSTAREKKPEFFGPRGWLAVLLPMIIFLGGINIAAYVEKARVHTALKESANRSHGMMRTIMQAVQQDSETYDALLNLGWPDIHQDEANPTRDAKDEESYDNDLTNVALAEHYKFEEVAGRSEMAESVLDNADLRTKIAQLSAQVSAANNNVPIPTLSDWKEMNDFLIRLLKYEDEGKTRPIIADYFAAAQEWARQAGREPKAVTSKWFPDDKTWYPTNYAIVILLTTISVIVAFPKYLRDPFRVSPLAIGVGVLGIFVWIGLWWLDKEVLHLGQIFSKGAREAFNPFEELKDNPTWMWAFLGIRFWGLVIIIPIVEEFFLRGWLMRYIDSPDWDQEPIAKLTRLSAIGIVVYAVISHPAEPLAAVVWFGMVTALFVRTKSIWDCVVVHFVTNLLLGLFVVFTGTWELW